MSRRLAPFLIAPLLAACSATPAAPPPSDRVPTAAGPRLLIIAAWDADAAARCTAIGAPVAACSDIAGRLALGDEVRVVLADDEAAYRRAALSGSVDAAVAIGPAVPGEERELRLYVRPGVDAAALEAREPVLAAGAELGLDVEVVSVP